MPRDRGKAPERISHSEDTLFKVYMALSKVGITGMLATNAVTEMQNSGIVFKERGDNHDNTATL